jgi:hypothetical protein
MSFIKLDKYHQPFADLSYKNQEAVIAGIDFIEKMMGENRWFLIGRTDIERGFMAIRKGITQQNQEFPLNKQKNCE